MWKHPYHEEPENLRWVVCITKDGVITSDKVTHHTRNWMNKHVTAWCYLSDFKKALPHWVNTRRAQQLRALGVEDCTEEYVS